MPDPTRQPPRPNPTAPERRGWPRPTLHAGGIHRRLLLTTRRFRAIRDLLVATDRMRDRWAEGDQAVKGQLWTDLHTKADELREAFD